MGGCGLGLWVTASQDARDHKRKEAPAGYAGSDTCRETSRPKDVLKPLPHHLQLTWRLG